MTFRAINRWRVVLLDDATDGLVDNIARFYNSQFGDGGDQYASAEEFRWKLGSSNPGGRGLAAVAVHGDDIIGLVTATLKRGRVNGQPISIAEMGDVFVRSGFQKSARSATPFVGTTDDDAFPNKSIFARLALELSAALAEGGTELVFGTPNEQALPGWVKRIGYKRLDRLCLRSWHRPAAGLLARAPKVATRAAAAAFGGVARPVRRPWLRGLVIDELDLAGDDVDALWARCSAGPGVEVVQDHRYVEHRFVRNPSATYERWALRCRGRLVGILVGRALDRPSGNSTYCIADWLLADEARSLLPVAIGAIAARRSSAVDTVSLWTDGTSLDARMLWRLGFMRSRPVPVVVAPTTWGASVAASGSPWDMRVGWSDNV